MAGAAIMYFLDPAWGRSRRARLQQKAGRLGRVARHREDALARNTLNHVQGALHAIRGVVDAEDAVDDVVLVERVKAALGRTIANPHGIDVKAFDGRVVLRGPVTPEELAEIVACTQRVRGVREVDNRLSPNTGIGAGTSAP
jgi:osmotically-inducible protein OsmY